MLAAVRRFYELHILFSVQLLLSQFFCVYLFLLNYIFIQLHFATSKMVASQEVPIIE